ncbi:hypothetical protein B0T16DRAFT_401876 [Cercophora newfieldiana]|uniref:Uncharacterized protein n=1 Tax=Cercophora newfieldiana TaxID=92897 RepID=A0AA39YU54_9PEZI|nr:hypothetical protein B0T16DRAFT_401876 [Cercophora newfieldiana]
MENVHPPMAVQDDSRASKRGRIMGKLFGRDRERKVSQEDATQSTEDLNDFLRGPSDTLQVAHAGPPTLARLDLSSVTRYPNALDVQGGHLQQQDLALRPRSHNSNARPKKGLAVRFVDTYPEVIGTGGDECELPTVEISKRRKPRPPAVTAATAPVRPLETGGASNRPSLDLQGNNGGIGPGQLRRVQTGFTGPPAAPGVPEPSVLPAGRNVPARFLDSPVVSHDEKRRSFIEIHQAEMREAEGLAFAKAVRTGTDLSHHSAMTSTTATESVADDAFSESPSSASAYSSQAPSLNRLSAQGPPPPIPNRLSAQGAPISSNQYAQRTPPPPPPPRRGPTTQASQMSQASFNERSQIPQPPPRSAPQGGQYQPQPQAHDNYQPETPEKLKKGAVLNHSPTSIHSVASSFNHPYAALRQESRASERDIPVAHSSPRKTSTLQDVVSAAADDALSDFVARTRHLFELFRLHSESVRPLVSCSFEDLARGALWWFLTGRSALEVAIKDRPTNPEHQMQHERAKQQAYADLAKGWWLTEEIMPEFNDGKRAPPNAEVDEVRATIVSNLRKLAVSMKKNDFLPPEEAFLPAIVDRSIWLEYPQLNQDVISLLWGSSSSSLTEPKPTTSGMNLMEGLPLSDSPAAFCFARFRADVYLMEQGREAQQLYFPCLLSIVRPRTQPDIIFVIASQNGAVQLRISGSRSFGPTWEDVRWRSDNCTLEIRLPRGFFLVVQCSQANYKMLWNMYDYSAKVHASLYPRQDEQCIFRSTLRAFQYFDNDPQSRQFPKESTPGCDIAVFERLHREGAAAGPRTFHRGYRVAVVTGTTTKTLSGVNQAFTPQAPVQYGFLRSDTNDPALSLKFDNGRLKGNMVLSFTDEQERLRLHSLLIGAALNRDEQIFCEVPLQGIWFSERDGDANHQSLRVISSLPWQRVRVINHDNDGDRPPCVLADRLRVVYEFKEGTLTDRINVAPGELRLRLDVRNPNCLVIYRPAQTDLTIAVMEAMVHRDLPSEMNHALDVLRQTPTMRTLIFPSVSELHAFETAITGYKVLYDGVANTFAIARRRMVVPIHKKWEAGQTRIQVVQQDGVVQLLAFFDDFAHGRCMGFSLKGTDVFESFGKGSKAGLKIVDAKFPLPKPVVPGAEDAQGAAEVGFVCLDLPELPGEHDDISITFDSEQERDLVAACLPAPVKGSRMPIKIKGLS